MNFKQFDTCSSFARKGRVKIVFYPPTWLRWPTETPKLFSGLSLFTLPLSHMYDGAGVNGRIKFCCFWKTVELFYLLFFEKQWKKYFFQILWFPEKQPTNFVLFSPASWYICGRIEKFFFLPSSKEGRVKKFFIFSFPPDPSYFTHFQDSQSSIRTSSL